MTKSSVAFSDHPDCFETGKDLGRQLLANLDGQAPDAVVVFASSRYNYANLLGGLEAACMPKTVIGCSSAGEFIAGKQGVHAASAIAILSDKMLFTSSMATNLRADRSKAARQLAMPFRGRSNLCYPYRSILLLTDALAGHTDDFIEQLTLVTGGAYQMFGGGAGDDGKFAQTHVFHGTEAASDAVVALEILSHKPLGIGAHHGWQAVGRPMRVTEADGIKLISLNATLAVEVFEQHAASTNQSFDRASPTPFFLHNALGIHTEYGHKLRVPLAVRGDGAIVCASDIPTGATVSLMSVTNESSIHAASLAAAAALKAMDGHPPQAVIFFDCVATRLRMGKDFNFELQALEQALSHPVKYVGCNTYGQIARAEGQFNGFHNCTAVVCAFPE